MSRHIDLVFDLDGTISDPAVGITRSINHALSWYGLEEVSPSRVSELIGPPLDEAFRSLVPTLAQDDISALISKCRERYASVGYKENSIYCGIPQALKLLCARGMKLGVCISKRMDFAESILDLFDLRPYFSFVHGGDVGIMKVQQLGTLVANGLIGAESQMIGDRAVDIHAARRNGLGSIGVLWGHGTKAELMDAKADLLLESPSELVNLGTAA